jgi:CRP-like cAMP-binding protein
MKNRNGIKGNRVMASKAKAPLSAASFLAKAGEGRSIHSYRKGQAVFSQGGPADAIYYIQKGKVKLTVVSAQGKEAVVAILGVDDFLGEARDASRVRRDAWQP